LKHLFDKHTEGFTLHQKELMRSVGPDVLWQIKTKADLSPETKQALSDVEEGFCSNSGDRIRTCDLRVMSPTSYLAALPRIR
jgi:hypothetical protein